MKKRIAVRLAIATLAAIAFLVLNSSLLAQSSEPSAPNAPTLNSVPSPEPFVLLADRDGSLVKNFGRIIQGPELDIGLRTFTMGTEEYNTALHFTLPDELRDKPLRSAMLKLYYRGAWGSFSDRAITAHRITENWSNSTVRITVRRDAAFATNSVGGETARWISWDATELARSWATNSANNFGVILVPDPIGSNDNSFRFTSSRTEDVSFYPALEITGFSREPSPVAAPMRFLNATPAALLEFYGEITQRELIVASNVAQTPYRITIESKAMMTRDAGIRLIERALLEQAGVVITPLEGNRASVTYNDALNIPPPPAKAEVK